MAWINYKIGTISNKIHYPYEGIFWKATPPEYIIKTVTGNGYVDLTNAVANHLIYLKLFGLTEQWLPAWYTLLDWITGDWNAYIDLDIQLTEDDEADVYFTKPSNLASSNVFWWRTAAWQNNISVIIASSWNVVLDFNNSDYTDYRLNTSVSLNTQYKAVLNKTGRYIYQWDTLIDSNTTACADTIETPWTYLFNLAWGWLTSKFAWTINRCVIKWKKDLIPCKDSNNVVWMYDIINGVFYTNANDVWNFTAWNNVVPTPSNPIDIVCNNWAIKYTMNMANVNEQTVLVGYYISSQWVLTSDSNNRIYQEYIPVLPETTYTLSLSASVYYVTISEYSTDDDSWFIIRNAGSSWSNTSLTITTTENTNYVRFWTNIDRSVVTMERVLAINWQLEKWDTATPYRPYSSTWYCVVWTTETVEDELGNTATAEMLLAVNTYKDTQEIISGAVTKKVAIKVFDGTETRSKISNQNAYYTAFDDMLYCNPVQNGLSNKFVGAGVATADMPDNSIKLTYTTNPNRWAILFKHNDTTTLEDRVQFVKDQYDAGDPIIALYPLATETTETVTWQTLNIQTWNNRIEIIQASIGGLPMEVQYKATA